MLLLLLWLLLWVVIGIGDIVLLFQMFILLFFVYDYDIQKVLVIEKKFIEIIGYFDVIVFVIMVVIVIVVNFIVFVVIKCMIIMY